MANEKETTVERLRIAAEACSDVNMFHAVMALLSDGFLYSPQSNATAQRIIHLCRTEAFRQGRVYDAAIEDLENANRPI